MICAIDYPELDLTPILTPGIKFAVRCESKEEARHFIAAMTVQFPDKVGILSVEDTRWNNDLNGNRGGRAYFPDANNVEKDPLMAGDVQYAQQNGYTLVKFEELKQDDIAEASEDLSILFGGVSA